MAKIDDRTSVDDGHSHILWRDNKTSPAGKNNHQHTWRAGNQRTSVDEGHSHKIPQNPNGGNLPRRKRSKSSADESRPLNGSNGNGNG